MAWRRVPDGDAVAAMSEALRRGLIEASRRRDVPENWGWPSRLLFVLGTPGLVRSLIRDFARELLALASCVAVFLVVRAALLNPMSGAALWFVLVVGGALGAVVERSTDRAEPDDDASRGPAR